MAVEAEQPQEPEVAVVAEQSQEPELSGALETLAELRAKESATYQAYNNALYEQENPDEVEARKERFEEVEAEKQAYLDSISSELRAQIEAEQQLRIEQARAAAPEIREKFASAEPSGPATIPPQPIQGFEAEVPPVEKTREPQLAQVEQPEEPELQLGLQAAEIEEAPKPQPDLQAQQEGAAPAATQYSEEGVDPTQQEETVPVEESTPPPSEAAEVVAAEAASFLGTPAVEEDAAPSQQQEPAAPSQQQEPAPGKEGTAPVTGAGKQVVTESADYYGTPYKLGGPAQCVPYETMDCSCLTMTVYAEFGISLPDDPHAQMGYGTAVVGAPQAGDLVGWSEDGSGITTHVGIATGNGTVIHASAYAGNVVETRIEYIPGYLGARRLL